MRILETIMRWSFNIMRKSSKRLWRHLGARLEKMTPTIQSRPTESISAREWPEVQQEALEQEPSLWPEPWTGPFRFFDLPPELRAQIYQIALVRVTETVDQTHLVVRMRDFPIGHALKVSPDFGREYWYEARQQIHLIIDDSPKYKWQVVKLQPGLAQNVRTLEVHLRTICSPTLHNSGLFPCNVIAELQMHAMWLLKLTKTDLPALQSFTVNIYLDESTNLYSCRTTLVEYQRIFTVMAKLASLKVFYCAAEVPWQESTESYFDQERRLVLGWTSGKEGLAEVNKDGGRTMRCR